MRAARLGWCQTGEESQEATEMVQESVSPWFTREPQHPESLLGLFLLVSFLLLPKNKF